MSALFTHHQRRRTVGRSGPALPRIMREMESKVCCVFPCPLVVLKTSSHLEGTRAA